MPRVYRDINDDCRFMESSLPEELEPFEDEDEDEAEAA